MDTIMWLIFAAVGVMTVRAFLVQFNTVEADKEVEDLF